MNRSEAQSSIQVATFAEAEPATDVAWHYARATTAPAWERYAARGDIGPSAPLIEFGLPTRRTPWYVRAIEIPVAALALVASLPIMLLLAWLIARDTPGPILFFQTRVGAGTRPFRFVKFRTMYADAPKRFPELYVYAYSPDQMKTLKFKLDPDPRLTPFGRWLRRTSLDELPNFWNVLTGDMALVGPRPEIPQMLPYYEGEMLQKFTVPPGITGLAQVSGRGRLGFYETVDLDVAYVERKGFWHDAKLLLKTAKMVIRQDGAF
jgi:lipopolysaccharide/colanic/teichoic acid biosynthesis glycosyltransferase